MTIEQAQRLVWLLDEQRRCLKRANSLQRRILRLLADAPEDTVLAATALAHLEAVLTGYVNEAKVNIRLAAREPGELISGDDDDDYDPAA